VRNPCDLFPQCLLIDELRRHWTLISNDYPGVEDIRIIGIDLTRRGIDAETAKAAKKARKAAGGRAKPAKSASGERERPPKIASSGASKKAALSKKAGDAPKRLKAKGKKAKRDLPTPDRRPAIDDSPPRVGAVRARPERTTAGGDRAALAERLTWARPRLAGCRPAALDDRAPIADVG
jgi:hypothetical protein